MNENYVLFKVTQATEATLYQRKRKASVANQNTPDATILIVTSSWSH